jgi:hypothetical protein
LGKPLPTQQTACDTQAGETAYEFTGLSSQKNSFQDLSKVFVRVKDQLDPVAVYTYLGTCLERESFLQKVANPEILKKVQRRLTPEQIEILQMQWEMAYTRAAAAPAFLGTGFFFIDELRKRTVNKGVETLSTHLKKATTDQLILDHLNPVRMRGTPFAPAATPNRTVTSFLKANPKIKSLYESFLESLPKNGKRITEISTRQQILLDRFNDALKTELGSLNEDYRKILTEAAEKESKERIASIMTLRETQSLKLKKRGRNFLLGAAAIYGIAQMVNFEESDSAAPEPGEEGEIIWQTLSDPRAGCAYIRKFPKLTRAALNKYAEI